jgi:hypothetical protein
VNGQAGRLDKHSSRKATRPVGSIDDPPEAIHDAEEHANDEYLPKPFREGHVVVYYFTSCYRGLVGEGGAVARRSTGQQRCGR